MNIIPDYHPSECALCRAGEPMKQIDWSWIDHIYCISLKDREDRRKDAEREFHKAGLCNKVIFHRPVKDTSDYKRPGSRGCWNSHHTVAKKAYDAGADMVLVFEDDVYFEEEKVTSKNISLLAAFTKKLKNWNIIYLGSWPFLSFPTRFLHLHRDISLAAHAYLISNDAFKWLASTPYDEATRLHKNKKFIGFNIDVFYLIFPRVYGFAPMMAFQRGATSSNQRPNLLGKYLFNFALSHPRYMKYNQYVSFGYTLMILMLLLYGVVTAYL